MDPTLGIVLLVVGLVCLLLEIKIPGFFLAIPGTVLVLLGAMGLLVPSLLLSVLSPFIAIGGAVGASVLSIRFYKRLSPPEAPPVTSHPEGLVGETGTLVKAIGPDGHGRVRIRGQLWSCAAYESLPAGSSILVLGADSGRLIVGEVPDELRPGHGQLPAPRHPPAGPVPPSLPRAPDP